MNKQGSTPGGQQAPQPPIPFTRAARRKSIQAYSKTFTLTAGATTPVEPIELTAAGFLRYLEVVVTITSSGNAATVANPAVGDLPFNAINSIMVTNAAGDTIYVPIGGYDLYLINKYGGMYEPPFNDPRNDPAFIATTTGAGATAGTGQFVLRIPFELDPRDAFCALPNLASNKNYQISTVLASIAGIWAGGTAPNGTVTVNLQITMHYWSQPNAQNGVGYPQQIAPDSVGSVSLWRLQTAPVGGGNRITQLVNVGNVIREVIFELYDVASPSKRDDTDWSGINYMRLNNDQLFFWPSAAVWNSQMKKAFGYGGTAGTKDTAGQLDTGVYVVSDFQAQHDKVTVDGPRDQYLVTLDSTLLQLEAASFGANASILKVLSNEIKPINGPALYSMNVV
jgi:hypothetical protein